MHTDDMALLQQRIEINQLAKLPKLFPSKRIMSQQSTPKPTIDPRRRKSNSSHPDHAHGLPVQCDAQQTLDIEIPLPHAIKRAMRLAIQGLDQRDRKLRHRLGRICRDMSHEEAQCLGCREIDVVESRAVEQDGLDPVGV